MSKTFLFPNNFNSFVGITFNNRLKEAESPSPTYVVYAREYFLIDLAQISSAA